MPHDKGLGKQPFQFAQQGKQAATLGRRAGVCRKPPGIQPAFVAYANGVPVMPFAMRANAVQRSPTVNLAIARDVKMIAYVPESSVPDMVFPTGFKSQAPPLGGGGAMDDNQGNRPHAVINLHTN